MKVVEFDNSQEHREAAKSLGLSFFSEAPHYASVKIDWERIYKTCMLPMSRGVFVYEGEQPAGFMLSLLSPNWYDTEVSGKDLALFVSQDLRGVKAAKVLVDDYVSWARDNGAKTAWLGTTIGTKTDATVKFFNRLGFDTVGAVTKKEI